MNGGDPWVRTKDGIATPFQLRKKVLSFPLSVVHFRVFISGCAVFILFYFICGIYVANAFRTSVYGTLVANYLRWVVLLSCLYFRYGVAITLLVLFYVKGNKGREPTRQQGQLHDRDCQCP